MTPDRERTYEAIYAAAFVRELYEASERGGWTAASHNGSTAHILAMSAALNAYRKAGDA